MTCQQLPDGLPEPGDIQLPLKLINLLHLIGIAAARIKQHMEQQTFL